LKLTKNNQRVFETLLPRLNLNVTEPERSEIESQLQEEIYEAQRKQRPFEALHGVTAEERLDQLIAEVPVKRQAAEKKRWVRNYVSAQLMFLFVEGVDGLFQFALLDYLAFSLIALFLIDAMSTLITAPSMRTVGKSVWVQFAVTFILFSTYKALLVTLAPSKLTVLIELGGPAAYVVSVIGIVSLYIYWTKNPLRKTR